MKFSKRQSVRVIRQHSTSPVPLQKPCKSFLSFESESSDAFLSMKTSSVLDMDYDYVLEDILGPASSLLLPLSDSEISTLNASADLYSQPADVLSISKTFHTEFVPAPDVLLLSSDAVFFCVHLETIHRHCPEAFQSVLDAASSSQTNSCMANSVVVDCPSSELNIILHALYDMSLEGCRPGPDTVAAALDQMPNLGITVKRVVYPECALYQYILSYTPLRSLDVYAMAAHHGIHALAVEASSYLLNLNILNVSEDASNRMGPLYFVKLVRLYTTRFEALKADLLVVPPVHMPNSADRCSFEQQQQAKQVWALFCSEPLWHTRPADFVVQAMEGMLDPMLEDLTCADCRTTLRGMVARMQSQWITVPQHMGAISIYPKLYVAVTTAPHSTRMRRYLGARSE